MIGQSPVIEAWQVVTLLGSIALVVLGAYGTLILQNRVKVNSMWQRLFGTGGDDTDEGFLKTTMGKLDHLSEKMDSHHSKVERGLRENRERVGQVERQVERVEYKVDTVAQVVEDEHDVFFRGESDAETDGGRPAGPENERIQEQQHDADD